MACVLLSATCNADNTVSDDDFFNFIQADVKKAPVTPPPVKTPTEAEAMLAKWKNYEQTRREKQETDITATRKVLVEMLLKKSLTTSPEVRGALIAEVERIKALPPDSRLLNSEGPGLARLSEVVGKWQIKQFNATHQFDASGLNLAQGRPPNKWRWLDAEAGVFVTDDPKYGNLFWLDKASSLMAINSQNYRFNLSKLPGAKFPPPDQTVKNLAASESSQRQSWANELAAQRQRVIDWLLDKAKQMSADEMAQVVTKVHSLEIQAQANSPAKLKGKWTWENQEITFQVGGIIANRGGQKVGHWCWLASIENNFAVVFNGPKATAKDIFLLQYPADETQTSFQAHRINSGHITVTRKFP